MRDFRLRQWQCNRCGKWNRIKKVFESGEYLKTCKCGRTMMVSVRMEWTKIANPQIVGLRDCYRRCNRGTANTLIPTKEKKQ